MERSAIRRLCAPVAALSLAAVSVALAASAAAAPTHRWATYANARFGYAICYPEDLLTPQPEAENGDGRAFTGPPGVKLLVWGQYNALNRTLAEAMAEDESRFAGEGGRVTYRAHKRDWYVLSGANAGKVFYLRSLLVDDRFVTFELRYPAKDKAVWDPVAQRLSQCLAG